jgi:NitT/TauT family transport system permease protein
MRKLVVNFFTAAAIFASLLLLWVAVIQTLHLKPYMLPTPKAVLLEAQDRFASLVTSFAITSFAAAVGLVAAIVVGVLIAVVFAQSRWIRRMLYPYTILLQTVPIVAIAPLILMWIHAGTYSVALIAFIICLSPIIANTTQGLISVERNLVDLFVMNGASRAQIMFKLRLPYALPSLFTGIRISSGIAVIGAITGELFASSSRVGVGGIGYAIQYANSQLETDYLFALIGAATILGFTFFFTVMFFEWFFLHKWHESARSHEED